MRGRVSACAKIYFAENLSQVGMSSSPLVLSQYFQLHNKFLCTIGNKKNVGLVSISLHNNLWPYHQVHLSIIHVKMNCYVTKVTKQNFHMDKNHS